MILTRVLSLFFLLSVREQVNAFSPRAQLRTHVKSTSSLQMSAALIVQNKGGGHGELGKMIKKKDVYGRGTL